MQSLGEARHKRRSDRVTRVRPESIGAHVVIAIYERNVQTVGQRLFRVRLADAADGGPVHVKRAVVRFLFSELVRTASERMTGPEMERRQARLDALEPELTELRLKHSGDPGAQLRARLSFCRDRKADPWVPLFLGLAVQLCAHLVGMVSSPNRQGLPDLAAGIVVARERKSR